MIELPNFTIRIEDEALDFTPRNTELHTHGHNYSQYDHLFLKFTLPIQAGYLGAFVWRNILGENFDSLANLLRDSGMYPVIYQPSPTDTTLENWPTIKEN